MFVIVILLVGNTEKQAKQLKIKELLNKLPDYNIK